MKIKEFNFRELCKNKIKKTTYLTHGFFPYPAKFIPQIPHYFIDKYTDRDSIILDPFCGCGTTLVEAKILGRGSYGVDINPFAQLLTRVKATPLDMNRLDREKIILFNRIEKFKDEPNAIDFINRDFWFLKEAQKDLTKIKCSIDLVKDDKIKDFFLVCLASIVRKSSNADPKISKPVYTKTMRSLMNRRVEPIKYFKEKVEKYTVRMNEFNNYISLLGNNDIKAEVIDKDARNIKLDSGVVSLIVTSPPFITAQEYFRTMKFEIYWTGLGDSEKINELKERMIGLEKTRNYHSNELHLLKIKRLKKLDDIIKKLYAQDKNRAFILYQYFVEMKKAFQEFKRVLSRGGYFVITIGDNIIRKIPIKTHELIVKLAEEVGFKTECVGYDVIRAHALMTKRNITGGVMNIEWIMVFKKP